MNRTIDMRSKKVRVGRRGFTLIELLVAVMAGLLVAAAAVSFSRQSTRFFSQEARIAAAQMSVLSGFQRLQADVARAAYMSTTDIQRDLSFDRLCAPNFNALPTSVKALVGIRVLKGDDGEVLQVAGNLSSAEMYPVLAIEKEDLGHTVYFQENNGPMTRSGFLAGGDGDGAFQEIFRPGRLLRIIDQQGKQIYEVIEQSGYSTTPRVKTAGPLPMKAELSEVGGAVGAACGIAGFGIGVLANPVNMVRYQMLDLKSLKVSPYKETIFADEYQVPGSDDQRMELVRQEMLFTFPIPDDPSDPPPELEETTSYEVVAEYAVDFRVGLWRTNPAVIGLEYMDFDQTDDKVQATQASLTDVPGAAPTGPTAIRSVNLRLAVRSRESDRATDVDPSSLPDGGFLLRAPTPDGRYARVRTLTAAVTLMNHRGDAW